MHQSGEEPIFIGFLSGFVLSRVVGLTSKDAKTIAIEVGIQNGGLATVLAIKHFSLVSSLIPTVFSVLEYLYSIAIFPVRINKKKQCEMIGFEQDESLE